jgi:hypothetical protein
MPPGIIPEQLSHLPDPDNTTRRKELLSPKEPLVWF